LRPQFGGGQDEVSDKRSFFFTEQLFPSRKKQSFLVVMNFKHKTSMASDMIRKIANEIYFSGFRSVHIEIFVHFALQYMGMHGMHGICWQSISQRRNPSPAPYTS
jgi:hypothetical protein